MQRTIVRPKLIVVNEASDAKDTAGRPRTLGRATSVAVVATTLPIIGAVTLPAVGLTAAPWLREQGWVGVWLLIMALATLGSVALTPTYTSSLIAGWTFGFARGFFAVTVGLVSGALVCYLLARRLAHERVAAAFAEHPKWDVVRKALLQEKRHKALWIVFLLRLSPVLPFGTTNVLLATTGVPLLVYALGTVLGLMPRMALIALAATRAERLDFNSPPSWWTLTAGVAATAGCVVVLAVVGKRALDRTVTRNGQGRVGR